MEATNMARFSQNFASDPFIFAPKIYWDLTHRNILVMDYIDGIPLDDIDRLLWFLSSGSPPRQFPDAAR